MSIIYENIEYASLYDLYRSIGQKPVVSVEAFCTRIRSRRIKNNGELSDFYISQALFLDKKEYFLRYGRRKTEIVVNGNAVILEDFYKSNGGSVVTYGSFRQRVRRLIKKKALDKESLSDALVMDSSTWISFHGGGRRNEFVYEGESYPECYGKKFSSVTAFLRIIGMYGNRILIRSRLKKGWSLDDAVENSSNSNTRVGLIYQITNIVTGQIYIGLTTTPLSVRWSRHVSSALNNKSSSKLAKSIREYGPDSFSFAVLEDNICEDILPLKEKKWIQKLCSKGADGLNTTNGGELGWGHEKEIVYEGKKYDSVSKAAQSISKKTGFAEHVIIRRIRNNEHLPSVARKHSKHPDAGSNLWRRWKQLIRDTKLNIRSGEVADEWLEYDNFKNDTFKTFKSELCLTRKDETLPWGKNNFEWSTKKERVARTFGEEYGINGTIYNSLTAVAEAYGINLTTLKYRIEKLNMNIEEAVSKKLGKTSKNNRDGVVFEGIRFDSANKAHIYAAKKYNISLSKAKDRITRGLPLDKPDHAIPCVVNGIDFKSESAAAAHFGINKSTFQKRKRLGWSLEQALGLIAKEA